MIATPQEIEDARTIARLADRLRRALWHRDNWAALAIVGWGLAAALIVNEVAMVVK